MDTDSDWGSQQTVAFPTPSPLKGWSSVKKKGNAIDFPTNTLSSDSDGDDLPEIAIGLPNSSKRRRVESMSNTLPRSPLSKNTYHRTNLFSTSADTTEKSKSSRDPSVATSTTAATTHISSTLDISITSVSSANSSERPSTLRRRTSSSQHNATTTRPQITTTRPHISTTRPHTTTTRPNTTTTRPNSTTTRPHTTTSRPHMHIDPDSSIDCSPIPLRERMKMTLEQECILICSSDEEPQSPNNSNNNNSNNNNNNNSNNNSNSNTSNNNTNTNYNNHSNNYNNTNTHNNNNNTNNNMAATLASNPTTSSYACSSTFTSTSTHNTTTATTSPFIYTTSSAFASSTTTTSPPPPFNCDSDPPIVLLESDDDDDNLPTSSSLDLYTSPATTFENLRQHKKRSGATLSPTTAAWQPTATLRKRASQETKNKTKTKEDKAQEKAMKAAEKAQEKLRKASERERLQREKKENLERDRAEKRAEKSKQKKRTTTERMSTMIMRVTEDVNMLLQDCDEVYDLLCSSEITVTQFECGYDRTIQWQRKIPHTSFDRIGTFEVQDEKFAMVLMSATEFIALLCNRELMTHVVEIETRFPQDYQLTLVVEGLQTFFKSQKLNQNKAYRERILQASGQEVPCAKPRKRKTTDDGTMTQAMRDVKGLDVETALVAIQCETSVMLRITESSKETAAMIHAYSRGVACLPDQQQFTGFGFSPHDRAPETVDKNGFKGLKRVWLRHLQQFNGLSEIKAQAIVDTYCSPRRLITVFTKHGKHAIKDIKVRRGERNRSIGPKVSEVLHQFYTSLDHTALVE